MTQRGTNVILVISVSNSERMQLLSTLGGAYADICLYGASHAVICLCRASHAEICLNGASPAENNLCGAACVNIFVRYYHGLLCRGRYSRVNSVVARGRESGGVAPAGKTPRAWTAHRPHAQDPTSRVLPATLTHGLERAVPVTDTIPATFSHAFSYTIQYHTIY